MLAVVEGSSWESWKWPGRGPPARPAWMIGPCLVLAFTWPWGLCWQLLVNFLHWGHSLTFYLSANYLTFSTYHLLFFKWLEAHPHFDIFFTASIHFTRCWGISLSSSSSILFFSKKNDHWLHNHIKKQSSHFLIAISNTSLVRDCQRPNSDLRLGTRVQTHKWPLREIMLSGACLKRFHSLKTNHCKVSH